MGIIILWKEVNILPMKRGFNSSYVLNPLKIGDIISC